MKIGIVGAGETGTILANHFCNLGAVVSLYTNGKRVDSSSEHLSIKPFKVERIQKRFLETEEELSEESRMRDLFRIFYSVEPQDNVMNRVKENPELFEKLGEDVVNSLSFSVESFEDVDVVIDARGSLGEANFMGPGGAPTFNESRIMSEQCLFYGDACFEKYDEKEKGEITLVGSSKEALSFFLKCKSYLERGMSLNIVTSESSCFRKAYSDESLSAEDIEEAKGLIKKHLGQWKKECDQYTQDVQKWRALEDFERRKIDPPQMPEPQLKIYESYTVTSVDKLLDRDKLFLTLEMPPWRDPKEEKKPLMTLAQDKIFALCGHQRTKRIDQGLQSNEPGFYYINDLKKENSKEDLCTYIEKDLMRFFSKA